MISKGLMREVVLRKSSARKFAMDALKLEVCCDQQRTTLSSSSPYPPLSRIRFFPQAGSFFPQGFLRHPVLAPLSYAVDISTHNTFLQIPITCPHLDKLVNDTGNPHTIQCHHQLYLPRYLYYPHGLTPLTRPVRFSSQYTSSTLIHRLFFFKKGQYCPGPSIEYTENINTVRVYTSRRPKMA